MGLSLDVNGHRHEVDADPSTPLLYVLRNDLNLCGPKFGCGLGQCGACMVLMDGDAMTSCQIPLSAASGSKITTVEGLGSPSHPGALQQAFIDIQAAQCGYCTAGMIVKAQSLLETTPNATEAQIRDHMEANLCRCGTYSRIVKAIKRAQSLMFEGRTP